MAFHEANISLKQERSVQEQCTDEYYPVPNEWKNGFQFKRLVRTNPS